MIVMVARNAKFHHARLSRWPTAWRKTRRWGQPELGDDVERDHVTHQMGGLLGELGGQVGGRGGIGDLGQGWHRHLQD